MKKQILLTFLIATGGTLFSQNQLSVSDLQVERNGDQVVVKFQAISSSKSPKINYTYTFIPTIINGSRRYSLKPIVVGSRRADILNRRKGINIKPFYHKGDTVNYRCITPYEEWMADAALVMQSIEEGCCQQEQLCSNLLATHILPKAAPPPVVVVQPAPPVVEEVKEELPSAGKRMAEKYSFVAPLAALHDKEGAPLLDFSLPLKMGKAADEQQQRTIEKYLAENENEALKVYFHTSRTVIDPMLGANAEQMRQLLEAINTISSSTNCRITHIVIAGFASPEGALHQNELLAWQRAVALKRFIAANTPMLPEQMYLYNGGENWTGLRNQIAQGTMKHRDEVLHIIDNVPVRKGRETQLMDLHIGNPYRYMMKHYFPKLRHAACIKVYYQETTTETK